MSTSSELAQAFFGRCGIVYEVGQDGQAYGLVEVGGRVYPVEEVVVAKGLNGEWRESLRLPGGQWVAGRVIPGVNG